MKGWRQGRRSVANEGGMDGGKEGEVWVWLRMKEMKMEGRKEGRKGV